jgi:hypothetical protein
MNFRRTPVPAPLSPKHSGIALAATPPRLHALPSLPALAAISATESSRSTANPVTSDDVLHYLATATDRMSIFYCNHSVHLFFFV